MFDDSRCVQLSQLIALAADGAPPSEFCLLHAGETRTTKGAIKCDQVHAAVCLSHETLPADGLLPLDYDHGMVSFSGEKKAAGWFKLAERNGALWATDVQFTPAAEKALREREYRYFSPCLYRDDQGFVVRMVNCALTCLPATLKQTPLVASQLSADEVRRCSQLRAAPENFDWRNPDTNLSAFDIDSGVLFRATN